MATIVYLSNQMVQAVEMRNNGSVSVYEELAPEGSIINGMVTDEEIFVDFLKRFLPQESSQGKTVPLLSTVPRSRQESWNFQRLDMRI